MVANIQGIRVPKHGADTCGHRSPSLWPCTRATGHTGRHHFAWTHLDGRVREVWAQADCQVCGRETTDGAVCRECGA